MQTDTSQTATRNVILYSQPGCAPCFAARMFLKSRAISFEYKDIQASPEALSELMALGSRSTPTLVVNGEVMIGFDPRKLESMLARDPGTEPAG